MHPSVVKPTGAEEILGERWRGERRGMRRMVRNVNWTGRLGAIAVGAGALSRQSGIAFSFLRDRLIINGKHEYE
jgi:hypothetical protein